MCKGYALVSTVVAHDTVETLRLNASFAAGMAGVRHPHLTNSAVGLVVRSANIRELVETVLGPRARVIRSVFFDKTPESNWGVPWHQDLTIAVREKREAPGFVGRSVKEGVHHIQAPREILEQMLTVRIHLDDCGAENGPLRVLPGTHSMGWLDSETITRLKIEVREEVCVVERGGAVLMRPLLLHASSRAITPGHRRVLHLDFAAEALPCGLRWLE